METHSDRLEAYATTFRRATAKCETGGNPEYFRNYFKNVKNSQVSLELVNL
jgi:hypothetical protein